MTKRDERPGYVGDKERVRNRLRRIAGQVGGLERMVEEERYCIDVVTQISAVRAALRRVEEEVLRDHIGHCVVGAESGVDREELTEEMMEAVARLLKSR